jgi:hypothetical protein
MRTLSIIAAATTILAAPVHAQVHPQTRSGFTIGFGIGAGSATFDCGGCNGDQQTGRTGYLRIGGTVRPDLIVAGEIDAWSKTQNGATVRSRP